MAVVDVFDALTCRRPHKEALPVKEALRLVRNDAGRRFDPQITEAFVDSQSEILDIRERFLDARPDLIFRMSAT